MAQCPGCFKMFTSQGYLRSHLQQSVCSTLLGNRGTTIPTFSGTVPKLDHDDDMVPPTPGVLDRQKDDIVSPLPPAMQICMQDNVLLLGELNDDDSRNSFAIPLADDHSSRHDSDDNDNDSSFSATANNPMTDTSTEEVGTQEVHSTITKINDNESLNAPSFSDDRMIPMLKLMTVMRKSGAPLTLLDAVVKILKEEDKVGRLDMSHLCTNRTAIRRFQKLFPALPRPSPVTVTHERTSHEMRLGVERPSLTFPVFSFLGQLEDLLNDHLFSDLNNLVVDPLNRWTPYRRNSCPHSTHEIQDGDWFQNTVESMFANNSSTDGVQDFLIGIQGYVDKTGTDALQRTSVEPLVFTLTLFTNTVRNSSSNWRVLALLPSSISQKQRKQHAFGASVRNYHIALTAALTEFIELQKNPPIVCLRLGDEFQFVRARLVWINTIADGLANEHLVGRIQNRTSSPRLSRGCHCPQHLADNAKLHCKFVTQASIQKLVVAALGPLPDSKEWNDYTNSLSTSQSRRLAEFTLTNRKKIAQAILKDVFGQHVVDLVWFHVYQGPNPRGCFGSTPVDPMHAFEEGVVPNILSVILDPLQESAKASLDAIALSIVGNNRWDREYPRMNFLGGFSSLTQLTADEKMGKLLLLWVVMQTPKGRLLIEKRCDSTFDAQRIKVASRFSGKKAADDVSSSEIDSDSDDELDREGGGGRGQKFVGSAVQRAIVKQALEDHSLRFVIPWIDQMSSFHRDMLHKSVFNICGAKGKGKRHLLPEGTYLDRYETTSDVTELYWRDESAPGTVNFDEEHIDICREARYSIDCTADELLTLCDMLLSFHATYKYGSLDALENFENHTRILMDGIRSCVNRGTESKNWSISKFHELLHMSIDIKNHGGTRNIDASKGEHGLKQWAKLPSKTVRTRSADVYYQDMATRIYENRLLELASSTVIPSVRKIEKKEANDVEGTTGEEEEVTITLSCKLLTSPNMEMMQWLEAQPYVMAPVQLYQEATYATPKVRRTLRASPDYRSTGPWYDWVLVQYEIQADERALYPFQVHGLFTNQLDEKVAVGKMGLRPLPQGSKLVQKWSMEDHYRLVDLHTIHESVFAIMIPKSCYLDGQRRRDQVLIMKDRIGEWPEKFNEPTWCIKNENMRNNNKKRKKN